MLKTAVLCFTLEKVWGSATHDFWLDQSLPDFGCAYLHFATPRLIDFDEDVSNEKDELERAGFLFKTTE